VRQPTDLSVDRRTLNSPEVHDSWQLLGADPNAQAQHDVGMHQLGQAANILQARAQLYPGQDPRCGDNCPGLLQGEGLGAILGSHPAKSRERSVGV
jgi:hypothetical protein